MVICLSLSATRWGSPWSTWCRRWNCSLMTPTTWSRGRSPTPPPTSASWGSCGILSRRWGWAAHATTIPLASSSTSPSPPTTTCSHPTPLSPCEAGEQVVGAGPSRTHPLSRSPLGQVGGPLLLRPAGTQAASDMASAQRPQEGRRQSSPHCLGAGGPQSEASLHKAFWRGPELWDTWPREASEASSLSQDTPSADGPASWAVFLKSPPWTWVKRLRNVSMYKNNKRKQKKIRNMNWNGPALYWS